MAQYKVFVSHWFHSKRYWKWGIPLAMFERPGHVWICLSVTHQLKHSQCTAPDKWARHVAETGHWSIFVKNIHVALCRLNMYSPFKVQMDLSKNGMHLGSTGWSVTYYSSNGQAVTDGHVVFLDDAINKATLVFLKLPGIEESWWRSSVQWEVKWCKV